MFKRNLAKKPRPEFEELKPPEPEPNFEVEENPPRREPMESAQERIQRLIPGFDLRRLVL